MSENTASPQRLALVSVSDKTGVDEFGRELERLGFRVLSTGGTARSLRDAGVQVTGVSEHTGFPEIMDGRVKTLHPKIHGGLLGRDVDQAVMDEQGIIGIDVVAVNLYPFERVTSASDCSLADAIENIDIGGPAMVRAAAKNHARVAIVTDPADYAAVIGELDRDGRVSRATRYRLAAKAYAHTARYDGLIADYLARRIDDATDPDVLPRVHTPQFERRQSMRYGENPHQQAAFYVPAGVEASGLAAAEQLQGKELSYNNIADADAALECVNQFDEGPACVIVKHANPCGAALGASLLDAYDRAHATDPVSAFGGIIAFNGPVDGATAREIVDRQFVEVVIAPDFANDAREAFSAKKNVRLLQVAATAAPGARLNYHRVAGGLLIQEHDDRCVSREDCRSVSERAPEETEWNDLLFAWKMVRMVKSNAIVYAADGRTLGIGAGQMSRVDSSRIAAWKAGEAGLSLAGSAMASDAFFPFRDSIDAAAEAGVKAIIQPGGSMRDDEVIAAANEHGIAMVFTGMRHFRH
ncbi:MAG: bifunctional phosphoribosylaminoimidazolecarboxamide formyltransferase/IMP cyclohydrolase [Xanthomonadales bacterium]|jgi:phosphoribosylaminoimidazolecarboxamide formyltransferase/IMP cyclohydrolase|nr:bifunctional phosphoribosylaminoimidazolecarboxamide formyltransferase/IMP cyclohydrolase [Xanthomonadales bacterium]